MFAVINWFTTNDISSKIPKVLYCVNLKGAVCVDLIRCNAEGMQDVKAYNMVKTALGGGLRAVFKRGIDI